MEEAKHLSPAWGPRGGVRGLAPWEAVFSVKVVVFTLKTELPGGEWQGSVVRPWLCAGSSPTWQVQMAWGRGTGKGGVWENLVACLRRPPWEAHQRAPAILEDCSNALFCLFS